MPEDDSPVKNGDTVELVHLGTDKLLNSHDVAAPLSPALQEVAGYINYSAQFTPYLQWKLVRRERGEGGRERGGREVKGESLKMYILQWSG